MSFQFTLYHLRAGTLYKKMKVQSGKIKNKYIQTIGKKRRERRIVCGFLWGASKEGSSRGKRALHRKYVPLPPDTYPRNRSRKRKWSFINNTKRYRYITRNRGVLLLNTEWGFSYKKIEWSGGGNKIYLLSKKDKNFLTMKCQWSWAFIL